MSGSGLGSHEFTGSWGVVLSVPVQRMKVRVFRSLVLPVLQDRCETWTLTRDLRWRLKSFGTRSLRRILDYHWSDFVSNEWLLRETQMRFVTCIVREHQLQLYGQVAHFPDADPAHQILSAREPRECRRPMGRPCTSCCSRLIGTSRRWGWVRHLPEGWPDGVSWSTGGKWTQRWRMLPCLT